MKAWNFYRCRPVWMAAACCAVLLAHGVGLSQQQPPAAEPSAAGAPADRPANRIVARIDAAPILLEIGPSQEEPVAQEATISITPEMAQHFGADNPILWAPLEAQSPLASESPIEGAKSRQASLGLTPADAVQITFDRGLLIADTPRKLTVTVPEPAKLAAGIYAGQIVSHLETLKHPGVVIEHVWPIQLRVTGRHLSGVQFHAATAAAGGEASLNVGQPASVSIILEAVNCSLGEGLLELHAPSQRDPLARIPLPLDGPLDPRTSFRTLKTRLLDASAAKAVWPGAWANHPLDVRVLPGAESTAYGDLLKQYEVRAVLPAVCEPGGWTARVVWERGEETALVQPVSATASATASAGICVSHPLAIVGETVFIQLLSSDDLGPTIDLVVGARNDAQPAALVAERTAIDGAGSGARYLEYRATFVPPALGEYSVRVAATAREETLAVIPATTFRAAFQAASALDRELILFDGAPPFWWSWQHEPGDGGSYGVTRPNAFRLLANADHFGGLNAELVAVGRLGDGKSLTLETMPQWHSEPQLSFPSQPQAADGELDVYKSDSAAVAALPLFAWPAAACPNNQLTVHQRLLILPEPRESDAVKAAAAHGERRYAMRLLVRGEAADGTPAARIVQVPYQLVITDATAYYRPAGIWGGAILGSLLLLGLAAWSINRRLTPTPAAPSTAPREKMPIASDDLSPEPREFSSTPRRRRPPRQEARQPSPETAQRSMSRRRLQQKNRLVRNSFPTTRRAAWMKGCSVRNSPLPANHKAIRMAASRCTALTRIAAVLLAFAWSSAASAQQAGLDVVMLVDVSKSMHLEDGSGSDPEQLRWDAVKLVLDLLTHDDRLLVLPFNDECPAKSAVLESRELSYIDAGYRAALGRQIEAFIPDRGETATSDDGGTGLLAALRVAKAKIEAASRSPRESARPKVVFLLTDGQQNTGLAALDDTPDDRLVNSAGERWKQDARVTFFRDQQIPIYTFGLGQEASMVFLEELAKFTGATPMKVDSNTQLVERFRELIWSVGRCFISKPFDGKSPLQRSGALGGALDFAVLLYEELSGAADLKRRSAAPTPQPQRTWLNTPQEPIMDARSGKRLLLPGSATPRPSGYAILYFDGRRAAGDARGTLFRDAPGMELELKIPAELQSRKLTGYFIKRMAVDFTVRLNRGALGVEGEYYRNEPIPLEVELVADSAAAVAQRYDMVAELVPSGIAADRASAGVVAVRLTAAADAPTIFRPTALSTARLAHSADLHDRYVLRITVREKAADGGLAYAHTLPPRLVSIKNAIPLKPSAVNNTLSRNSRQIVLDVNTVWPLEADLPLKVAKVLPKQAGDNQALPVTAIEYGPASVNSGTIALKAGRARLGVKLSADETKWPAPPCLYAQGGLSFTSADPRGLRLVTLRPGNVEEDGHLVPWGLRLGTVGLAIDAAAGTTFTVGPAAVEDRKTIAVGLADKNETPPAGFSVSVSLAPANDQQVAFTSQEFWIQEPGTVALPKDRRQSIALRRLGETFEIHFRPDVAKHADQTALIGTHAYLLRATGGGFDRPEVPLSLAVLRPELDFDRVGASISHVGPGVTAPAQMRLRMKWLPGGKLPVTIQPSDKIRVSVVDEDSEKQAGLAAFDVPYTGGDQLLELQSPTAADPAGGWTERAFGFVIPDDFRHGAYAGSLAVLLANEPLKPELPFAFRVDGLQSQGLVIEETQRQRFADVAAAAPPTPVDRVSVVQFFDSEMAVQIDARCLVAGTALNPANLKVAFPGPLQSDGTGPFLTNPKESRDFVAPPRLVGVTPGATPDSLRIGLLLGSVRNATPNTPYELEVAIAYRDAEKGINLGPLTVVLEATFVESQSLLKGKAGAAADGGAPR